ncbi:MULTISPECIES: endonuclease/exonuclease/phosphatase family protein [unclassified Nocardia]|uniref:endonuclease/exonuclease/phosphatase family protein n=1 Tax=unclassified Nocardia TaxID=2637762 RepID=UPI001CE3DD03|nr:MULTISPECIES: endonuclease/exonuclease/phosphatase family protein [unclassified Nocardia]
MRMWLRRLMLGAGWCAVLAGIAGIALHFGSARRQSTVLLAAGAPYLMAAALAGFVLCATTRAWRSAVLAGGVVVAVIGTCVPWFVADGKAATGIAVNVLQSNLRHGNGDAETLVRAVHAESVDLLTLEELTQAEVDRLAAAGIEQVLPYRYVQPTAKGGGGTGIYSRYPLRDTRKYDGFVLNNLSATMEHPERGPISVFAFHPVPPTADFAIWRTELGRIREILDAVPGPAIVGADFNATRDHSQFRDLLTGRFASAADQAGAGWLPTFPADRRWGPVIGIDHVLVADGNTEDIRTLTIPRSDHRALLARLRMTR